MWYDVAANKRGSVEQWTTGLTGSATVGDVNGDQRADAVTLNATTGVWKVGLSSGRDSFLKADTWSTTAPPGTFSKYSLQEINGDGKRDALSATTDGKWWVLASTGTAFGAPRLIGQVTDLTAVTSPRDVTGDGRADLVSRTSTGWEVRKMQSTGSTPVVDAPTAWRPLPSGTLNNWWVADVTGDAKGDLIMDTSSGLQVAVSNGTSFGTPTVWAAPSTYSASSILFADRNGDGALDLVGAGASTWWVRLSQGSSFGTSQTWVTNFKPRGDHGLASTQTPMVGQVRGTSKFDAITYDFNGGTGTWRVVNGAALDAAADLAVDTWEVYSTTTFRSMVPSFATAGAVVADTYDSADPDVIDDDLKRLAAAKVDFIVLDLTNALDQPQRTYRMNALAVCRRINELRSGRNQQGVLVRTPNPAIPKFAVALGVLQWGPNAQAVGFFEREAQMVLDGGSDNAPTAPFDGAGFVNNPECGGTGNDENPNYYRIDGKPLLVNHHDNFDPSNTTEYNNSRLKAWRDASHPYSQRFTVRLSRGGLDNPSRNENPGGNDFSDYFGWHVPGGPYVPATTKPGGSVVTIAPGGDNHYDEQPGGTATKYFREGGARYQRNWADAQGAYWGWRFDSAPQWISGHGVGSNAQLLGDVTGDGKADSVVYFGSGCWYVAPSTGHAFQGWSNWTCGHGQGSETQLLGDIDGDGRDDAVAFFRGSGSWYGALSSGSGFGGYWQWASGHGQNADKTFLADANGDGRDDAIAYFGNGNWYVALSNGSSFDSWTQWISGHGIGSTAQHVGDVNGDGRADAVVSSHNNGNWYVALSSGHHYYPYSTWATNYGASKHMLADATGDGKADIVVMEPGSGHWYVNQSTGSSFARGTIWTRAGNGIGSSRQFVSDVNGDGRADAVTFFGGSGDWHVGKASPVGAVSIVMIASYNDNWENTAVKPTDTSRAAPGSPTQRNDDEYWGAGNENLYWAITTDQINKLKGSTSPGPW